MEQYEITRRNVAIAEYMGWVKNKYSTWYFPPKDAPVDLHELYGTEQFYFNKDWQWLMPVVEKIMEESRLAFHAFPKGSGGKSVCRFGMLLKNEVGSTMIEATWKAVSEYVLSLGK